jgi:hypothetical protein
MKFETHIISYGTPLELQVPPMASRILLGACNNDIADIAAHAIVCKATTIPYFRTEHGDKATSFPYGAKDGLAAVDVVPLEKITVTLEPSIPVDRSEKHKGGEIPLTLSIHIGFDT